jgi:preprotein translocase subunit SecG
MTTFLILLMICVSILMILVVLVQRGRGGGLSGAFGAGGGSNSAFGTKTGDVFTTVTVVFFVVFMLLAIGLSHRFKATSRPIPLATAPAETPGGAGAGDVTSGIPAPNTGGFAPPATSAPAIELAPKAPGVNPPPAAATRP